MSVSQAARYAELGIDLSSIGTGLSEGHWLNALFALCNEQILPTALPQDSGLHVRYEWGFGNEWQTPTIDAGIGGVENHSSQPNFEPDVYTNKPGSYQIVMSAYTPAPGYPPPSEVSVIVIVPGDDGEGSSTVYAPLAEGDSFVFTNWYFDPTVPVVAGSTRWHEDVQFSVEGISFDIDMALIDAPTFEQFFNMYPDPSWAFQAFSAGAMLDKIIGRASLYRDWYQ